MSGWFCLRSPEQQLFLQNHLLAKNKENIWAPHCWPFTTGIHRVQWMLFTSNADSFSMSSMTLSCIWHGDHRGRQLVSIPDGKTYWANMGPPGADRTQVGPMLSPLTLLSGYSTLKQRQNDRHFVENIFKCIFVNKIIFWFEFHLNLS